MEPCHLSLPAQVCNVTFGWRTELAGVLTVELGRTFVPHTIGRDGGVHVFVVRRSFSPK